MFYSFVSLQLDSLVLFRNFWSNYGYPITMKSFFQFIELFILWEKNLLNLLMETYSILSFWSIHCYGKYNELNYSFVELNDYFWSLWNSLSSRCDWKILNTSPEYSDFACRINFSIIFYFEKEKKFYNFIIKRSK
jgi:hypothetical protein